ncbi:PP2C family protein-serine/threonine phosphatase [Phycisphaera mikurensis]|uniref:Putative phosphatase n=1 Tax=Phycisphaera mikurensis (strain NBRC 102666 / KCTC 22515 / FYK2301M01) TaxID=1142394 RepID=I0IGV5_PHYMF|nr:PP2C family protein-serine/threonine phosphatase [Phycisphaera mikurensis]MBB6440750.1 hypothetical protein [Phycisphaera mikurensis]BAM04493.1 putative phosphatase [Phycisphaera mikurensis NBRC 102666]
MTEASSCPPSAESSSIRGEPEAVGLRCAEVWGGNAATWSELVLPGLTGFVASRPHHGQAAGGDVHCVSSCGTGRITRLVLADVSGHGEQVAETGRRLRRTMQRYLNHIEPHRLAARMNRDMDEVAGDTGRFATAIVLTHFAPEQRMTVCNAGHPPPLVYRVGDRRWRPLSVPDEQTGRAAAEAGRGGDASGDPVIANLPLGVLENVGYRGQEIRLHPGDAVLVYTDCLIEAMNAQREMLGVEGLVDAANGLEEDPGSAVPASVIGGLIDAVLRGGHAFDDDLTAVLLRCDGPSPGATPARRAAGVLRALTAPLRRRPPPWPELSARNLIDPLCFWRKPAEPKVD